MKRKTLAIPVRLTNWSDTSQVITLFTRDFGILEALAKGAHRSRNPFQGPFDLASLWEVVFSERPPERGLSIVTEGVLLEGFRGLRRDWPGWVGAAYLTEYLRATAVAGEPSEEIFDALAEALALLCRSPGCPSGGGSEAVGGEELREAWVARIILAFEARALRLLGLSAPVSACSGCGRPWSGSDRSVFFSAGSGGILCAACRNISPPPSGSMVPGRAMRVFEDLSSRGSSNMLEDGLIPHLGVILRGIRLFSLEWDFRMLQYISDFFGA